MVMFALQGNMLAIPGNALMRKKYAIKITIVLIVLMNPLNALSMNVKKQKHHSANKNAQIY
jgi:hypothetical protein